MSSLSSLLIKSYTGLAFPIPLRGLLAQAAIVIPGAIINAKIAFPEHDNDNEEQDQGQGQGQGQGQAQETDPSSSSSSSKADAAAKVEKAETPTTTTTTTVSVAAVAAVVVVPRRPMTRTRESTCAARKKIHLRKARDLLDCVSDGARIGIRVAGFVL